jgi:hypothetical protein
MTTDDLVVATITMLNSLLSVHLVHTCGQTNITVLLRGSFVSVDSTNFPAEPELSGCYKIIGLDLILTLPLLTACYHAEVIKAVA